MRIFKSKNGFTVIELIVAMTIFVVLMSIAAGGLIHLLKSQRVVAGLMEANDSASLSLEQMAREIRTGYNFCLTESKKLQFVSAIRNEVVRYRLAYSEKLLSFVLIPTIVGLFIKN